MIKQLAHVCISSNNLEATESFYRDVLECTPLFRFLKAGDVVGFYLKIPGGQFIEVFRQDSIDAASAAPIRHLCIETDDLDGLISYLHACGIEISDKKMGADHSWQAWVTDPSGVRIEFHEYTDKSCQRTGHDCILD
jgi:glyoxylase I family protein